MHTSNYPNRLLTGHATFSLAKHRLHLFQLSKGIDANYALNKASELLAEVRELVLDAAMGTPLSGSKAWLTLHALESSKAIVDSVWYELRFPTNSPGQPKDSGEGP
ncbi:DUF3077 domain-containing protein [Pseudomonas sp. RIT-PI-S]|uniref:DUF3077 domain-containing protein n=1 Tax=Pseudomonas sp. RIT-PI-S TaxID=3035295 RepID=UPI0021D99566|nr:DUF3077 domain-containing protein [Pseudomonas sp. RIT-PI-S]